jgi:hypothetical protein
MQQDLQLSRVDEPPHKAETQRGHKEGEISLRSSCLLTQKMLLEAAERGEDPPKINITLPPNFLEVTPR